ncbi:MAG: cytochrome c oxidase cbb3-type subunit [Chthoniobacter sp.]|jgi:cytochrome c oxidase cbb3-type subunit 1|nr:cytochrome c oxidase cbb3-type subunit [Chthoniobacter sp.]
MNLPQQADPAAVARSRAQRVEIDLSLRGPTVHWLSSAVFWLLAGTVFALVSSHKMTNPEFVANYPWLTFGRVRPAHLNAVVYGWLSAGSIAVALWILARLCRAPLRHAWSLHVAAVLWNVGNLLGILGILSGRSTSIEWLEYPGDTTPWLIAAFALVMWNGVDMLRRRAPGHLYVSQWYLFAALFWFPMLYLTAQVLLIWKPVTAIAQGPVNWWFGHNVLGLWFTPVGLASAYYLIPKVIGRPIHSYYLSAIGFWSLAFFYAWNGMHHLIGGPYPAWLISASVAASVMMVVPVVTVGINHHRTMVGHFSALRWSPTLRFVVFGAMSYTLVSLQGSLTALRGVNRVVHFTHYTIAHSHLGMYSFATMMLFGSIYYIVPRVLEREWPSAFLIRLHFWSVAIGILSYVAALTVGGIEQGFNLQNADMPFLDIVRRTIPYLYLRTWAGILIAIGHVAFAISFIRVLRGRTRPEGEPTLLAAHPST